VVLYKPIDKIVILGQRDELKGGAAIDRDDNRFLMAPMPISAQVRLRFT